MVESVWNRLSGDPDLSTPERLIVPSPSSPTPPSLSDVLALAQLSSYLQAPVQLPGTSAVRPKALLQLLASFHQAEKRGLSDLADLYYNRAALHTYCQSFNEALGDYKRAEKLDPTLPVGAQVRSGVRCCQLDTRHC